MIKTTERQLTTGSGSSSFLGLPWFTNFSYFAVLIMDREMTIMIK